MREIWAEKKFNSLNTNLPSGPTGGSQESEGRRKTTLPKSEGNLSRTKIKGKIVVVTNIDSNVSTEYISISEAALALNITRTTLRTYMKNKTVLNIFKQNSSGNGIIKEQFIITVKEK